MSHSPLLHTAVLQPSQDIQDGLAASFERARAFVTEFDPTLIVVFAPDHYNGFFQDLMPPFCAGTEAYSVGDYDTHPGRLLVAADKAIKLIEAVHAQGVDMPFSRQMTVDHGMVQPLEMLFGSAAAKPIIPIFVNGVAQPLVPVADIRAMGQAVGNYLKTLDERVLIIASGGLSHDPPLPRWDETDVFGRSFLAQGRHPTAEWRETRQANVINGAAAFARGELKLIDLNPTWDNEFMDVCASGEAERFDAYQIDEMTATAGNSSHEARSWVAAFSAMSRLGSFDVTYRWYAAIREYLAGFGMMTAITV